MVHYFKIKTEICISYSAILLFISVLLLFSACAPAAKVSSQGNFPNLGIQIKSQRIKQGYSVKELANAVKISEQNLRLIEKGQATPVYPKLISIQEVLNTEFVLGY